MRKRKVFFVIFPLLILLLLVGFFVPIGSYTRDGICPTDTPVPSIHLHLITGQTLHKQKALASQQQFGTNAAVAEECTITTRYLQYLL